MTLLIMYLALFSSLGQDFGCRKQIGKWSEVSVLNIIVLKLVFAKDFVKTWSIAVDVFLVTLVGAVLID